MPSGKATPKAPHVIKGDVLDDLGLPPHVALEAKIKADLWRELVTHVERLKLTQSALALRLEVHQPDVSNLLSGRISRFSVGTLIQYAVRLDMGVKVKLSAPKARKSSGRIVKSLKASAPSSKAKAKAVEA